MNRNLVGNTHGMFCIKFPQNRMKGERHRASSLFLIIPQCWNNMKIKYQNRRKRQNLIQIYDGSLSWFVTGSETAWPNKLKMCGNHLWKILYKECSFFVRCQTKDVDCTSSTVHVNKKNV